MMSKVKRLVKRLAVAACLLFGAWQLVSWTEPLAAFTVLEALMPNVLWRVKTTAPLVGLSFDDGPDPTYTPQVLDILERHDARATFFVIGERAQRHPTLIRRIRAAGHEIGNHYFVGQTTLGHSDADFLGYLERTEQAAGIVGSPRLFRPPGGVAWPGQLRLARERGYTCVLGSAYPHDPARPPVAYIRWLIAKNLAPGAIVILHDGIRDPTRSIEALPDVLTDGRRRGFEFVPVGELVQRGQATTAHASSRTALDAGTR